jgi:excisionase family DNA binding protein
MELKHDGNDRLLTIREVSQLTRLAVGTLYRFSAEHRIPVVHLSRRCIRFRLSDLQRWIQQHSAEANEDWKTSRLRCQSSVESLNFGCEAKKNIKGGSR